MTLAEHLTSQRVYDLVRRLGTSGNVEARIENSTPDDVVVNGNRTMGVCDVGGDSGLPGTWNARHLKQEHR
jgi:hypothetical protein